MPLMPPTVILDTVSRERFEEAESSPFRLVLGPLRNALLQRSVTNRSLNPQKLVTMTLRDSCSLILSESNRHLH